MLMLAWTLLLSACGGTSQDEDNSTGDDQDISDDTVDADIDDASTNGASTDTDDTGIDDVDPDGAEGGDDAAVGDTPFDGSQIVLAVEQWPECLNPVTACSYSTWLFRSVLNHLQPRLMEFDSENTLRASPVLVEEPTAENGGAVIGDDGTFTVTYRLNPDARWSDGLPITSSDVWFTWRAVMDTEGTSSTTGYELIESIGHDDPQTAVVTYSELYAPWREMFSGILPAHAFGDDTDISDHWNTSITISGGPWIQQSWDQDQHILVPNTGYWVPERVPLVDRVVMIPRESSDVELDALRTGEVMAAQPQPFPGVRDLLTDDLTSATGEGLGIEGLWLNQAAPDRRFEITKNLRQALAYSLDRALIAEVALGSITDEPKVLQCAGWNPAFGDWCGDDFSKYRQDMDKVAELLTADGWTRPDPEGLWVKPDGTELVLQWNTVAGNKRREDVQALVTEMTRPFGIGWEIINYDPSELFQERIPTMDYGPVALYARGTSPDPSVVSFYDINGIPSEENGFTGQNTTAYASQEVSDLAAAIDKETDEAARLALVTELGALLAEDVPWIPLYTLPSLMVWNPNVLDGPGEWASSVYGGFYDMYDWTLIGDGDNPDNAG